MLFNLILSICDMVLLRLVSRQTKVGACAGLGALYALIAIALGLGLAISLFDFIRMASFGIFMHLPIVLFGSGIIWWKQRRKLAIGLAGLAIGIAVVGGYAFGIEPFWLEITHYEIASPKMKRPVRIVVVADLQTDQFGGYEKRILRETLAQQPDIILLAGDYLQAPAEYHVQLMQEINLYLRKENFSAPLGVFAVQGNVDGGDWVDLFARLEITTAQYRQQFDLDEHDLTITCLGESESAAPLELKSPDPKKFHLVMGHNPNFALGKVDADLLVAGHTHGGQVRLPFIGTLTTGCDIPRSWAAGITDLPHGGKLFVSRGVGMERGSAPRLRFLCRPELAVIDLIPKK